jgi:pyridoxine kinase
MLQGNQKKGGETPMNQPNHNRQKKIALINDFCGFGRCSIAVELPIISAMKVQCCPLPTAVFSDHTGFPSFFYTDYTDHMEEYAAEWKKLQLRFDGISTGFLGSEEQIAIVQRFLEEFKTADTQVLVDPVMGDYGKLYPTYGAGLAARMHELVPYADLLTPNLTEACILTDTPYRENLNESELTHLCNLLHDQGPEKVVISGISRDGMLGNFVSQRGTPPKLLWSEQVGGYRSGTGDVFSAILAADLVNGVPLEESVEKAARFIAKTIRRTVEMGIPATDGICIEECLGDLVP